MSVQEISETEQFLSFYLDKAVYAFSIREVKEVIDIINITRVPRMPDFMLGAINLRGGVVPVIDLCLKFGLSKNKRTIDTCIIIVETDLFGDTAMLGVMVDSITEVLTLDKQQIEASPEIGMSIPTDFIKGVGKKEDEFIVLLDINQLLSEEDNLSG